VFEETGITAKFVSILAIREKKVYIFGQSDIYFIALLTPITFEVNLDPGEIKCAQWMPIEEFAGKPVMIETQRKKEELALI